MSQSPTTNQLTSSHPAERSARCWAGRTVAPAVVVCSRCHWLPKLPGLVALRVAGLLMVVLGSTSGLAATRCVWLDSHSPSPPYSSWVTAARTIQEAVDTAADGDEILVTNGVYATGGRALADFPSMTNRVMVDKPVVVRSVGGPQVTVIRGYQVPGTTNGDGAVRCVYLSNGAVLIGFTLTKGATRRDGDQNRERNGGGVWCESSAAEVTNCLLVDNSADYSGGGARGGTLHSCMLTSNSAGVGGGACEGVVDNCKLAGNSARGAGGGAYGCTLRGCMLTGNSAGGGGGAWDCTAYNCTLTGNSVSYDGGGAYLGKLYNCIVYYNTAGRGGDNYRYTRMEANCCTTPLPASGTGNITNEPALTSAGRLSAQSPCRGAGRSAYARGVDLDGEAWLSPPSIGCDEYVAGAVTGAVSVAISPPSNKAAVGFQVQMQALIEGRVAASAWWFGDGTVVSNLAWVSHRWAAAGRYPVVLSAWNDSFPQGVSATALVEVVEAPVHYVAVDSVHPMAPYGSWSTAARTIQEAVDAAVVPGSVVLVSNGVYATGGLALPGEPWVSTRVVVDKPLVMRSVNGPALTAIEGYRVPTTRNGDGAIRCVYLGNGAELSGFTLRHGATPNNEVGTHWRVDGGGAFCESRAEVLTNCVLAANSGCWGGGAAGGTLYNCTLNGNWTEYYGGGGYYSTLFNCKLTGNSAHLGGGAWDCTAYNCMLGGNSADYGGGVYEGTLYNCTLVGNSAGIGGGSVDAMLYNCIVYHNTPDNYPGSTLNHCCTTPLPAIGVGNTTDEPRFVNIDGWADLRLQSDSPCINAGSNECLVASTDLDGRARIVGNLVDIGAYEYQGSSLAEFISWLATHGLPTDGSADETDADGDGHNNSQEWRCSTDPTNAFSTLRLLAVTASGRNVALTWRSVAGVRYFLDWGPDLGADLIFLPLATNLVGEAGTTTYTDTNAVSAAPRFYRVGVGD